VILIKKAGDGDSKKIKGCWDSIHVVEVQEKSSGRSAHYKLTSTCMLWLQTNKPKSGTMNLGGSLTRQIEQDATVSEASPHIANIGTGRQPVLTVKDPDSSSPEPVSGAGVRSILGLIPLIRIQGVFAKN
jgi:hypothetical protein